MPSTFRVAVLLSGNGSNLQALIHKQKHFNYQIAGVISNCVGAFGLVRAEKAGIDHYTLPHKNYTDRKIFDSELIKIIDNLQVDLVVMAGFMRILTADFTRYYQGKLINIHPSLLPAYRGLNTHRRVLEAGEKQHGASVHFATEELDAGAIIARVSVRISPADNELSLKQKVQQMEHLLYPLIIKWFAENRIQQKNNVVWLDNKPLPSLGYQYTHQQLINQAKG